MYNLCFCNYHFYQKSIIFVVTKTLQLMKKIIIRPKNRQKTSYYLKASQEHFLCPSNCVLTGRCHSGDENGKTWYEYAELEAVDENGNIMSGKISVGPVTWSSAITESSGLGFDAPTNQVIVGREHKGDENAQTIYATAVVKFDDKICTTTDQISSNSINESKGIWCCSDTSRVMTGRHHSGDENGSTYYNYSKIYAFEPSTDPAPKGTKIIVGERKQSVSMIESASSFQCPSNTVLTGRIHLGDENGSTIYEYASLRAISADGNVLDADITVQNITWTDEISESEGWGYDAPYGKVIVGRMHSGDENGETRYAIGEVFYNGHPTFIQNYHISAPMKESDGNWFKVANDCVITARHHYGDENGTTYYGLGMIVCDEPIMANEKIILHVRMHSEDPYFPMDPVDYIRLSRLRQHVSGGTDYGYSKLAKAFVVGDSHSAEYYDIPLSVIQEQHTPIGKYELMNLRPHDSNSYGKGEVFLQPDDHLTGDSDPNNRVASIAHYKDNGKEITYWFFFGYDYANVAGFSGSHEGDWENVTIRLDDNARIISANLSCHTSTNYYAAKDLEIKHGEKEELTVYCAKGSHAFYNKVGSFSTKAPLGHDHTDDKGYDWIATNKVISLTDEQQLWKYFAGAWGEVGEMAMTTGPLGPWQKCGEMDKLAIKHNSPSIKRLINENQALVILDREKNIAKETISESKGEAASITNFKDTQILYTYTHDGDENGKTTYYFASLKCVDFYGRLYEQGKITIEDLKWTEWHKQSESEDFFITTKMQDVDKDSRIITGREHKGDENGETRYQTGLLKCNGKLVKVVPYPLADMCVYASSGKTVYPKDNLVIIGIKHSGDENGITTYCQGYIVVDK